MKKPLEHKKKTPKAKKIPDLKKVQDKKKIPDRKKEQSKKKLPDLKNGLMNTGNKLAGYMPKSKKTGKIAYKLIIGFCVPVVLIVLLGTISYRLAVNSIETQYEQAATDTVSAMSLNCNLLCENIQNKAAEVAANDYIQTYYTRGYAAGGAEAQTSYRSANEVVINAKNSIDYIYSFSVFGEAGNGMTSMNGNVPADAYTQYMDSAEGQRFDSASGNTGYWSGYHTYLDEAFSTKTDKYAITYTRTFAQGNGFISLDIASEAIQEVLATVDNGAGSYVVLFTPDSRALAIEEGKLVTTDIFAESEVEEKALAAEESGSSHVSFDGESYLLSVSPIGKTGMAIVSLVPESTILASATQIRTSTVVFVILACVIALVIGTILARGISREVNRINKQMQKVSNGDFTTEFVTKRNDEFKLLTNGMTDMLNNIRQLLQNVVTFIDSVSSSSEGVASTADTMANSMLGINAAMEEVALGVSRQAEDTENGLREMSSFSDKLNKVYQGTEDMQNDSKQAMSAIEKGKVMVYELSDKSKAAAEITDVLIKNIQDVENNSKNIGSIIETIREIAEQTNLLSLNASIEAARAGEAGKGFSVVAEEIRKLADQSAEAGSHIREIVEVIQQKTQVTTESAKDAEEFLKNQAESIAGTVDIFGEINTNVTNLIHVLGLVADSMENMISDKERVLDSIRSIAAVSEQTSASTEEVTATVNNQLSDAQKLAAAAEELSDEVSRLQEALNKYNI